MKKADIIKDMFMNLVEGAEKHITVGELPKDLQKIHRKLERMRDDMDQRLDLMKKQAEVEFNLMVRREAGDDIDAIRDMKADFWEKVYEHFDLDGNEHYVVDEGKIFRVEEVDPGEAMESELEAFKAQRQKDPSIH